MENMAPNITGGNMAHDTLQEKSHWTGESRRKVSSHPITGADLRWHQGDLIFLWFKAQAPAGT